MKPAVGVLGGSFDPIHRGHLQLAHDALRALPLGEVRFMPAAQPWQKTVLTGAAHRVRMVELAIRAEPNFLIDLREIERGGPTYTADTLRSLRDEIGNDTPLVLIVGGDQFDRLDTWKDWQQLADLAHVAVAKRAGAPLDPASGPASLLRRRAGSPAALASKPAGHIVEFVMTPAPFSSTEVRRLLRQDNNAAAESGLRAALPTGVLDYIRANQLYR